MYDPEISRAMAKLARIRWARTAAAERRRIGQRLGIASALAAGKELKPRSQAILEAERINNSALDSDVPHVDTGGARAGEAALVDQSSQRESPASD